MAKAISKADLPQKICAQCGRPFAWRKKWARVWDEVRFCSERCKRARRPVGAPKPLDGKSG
ncbi:MAG: DUF2256 domain-containing protein [Paracoccaceae bacterium]|nr:DUF2256 domain-containing protein [Paracoccaceae bacterium]MDP5344586.1 DUF2256 domain-containing protein [Paracoccaceae bacterium]